jgi:large subunit ribosomal protein L6
MSRIGKQPVSLPDKVEAKIQGQEVTVKGPLGQLQLMLPASVKIEQKEKDLVLTSTSKAPDAPALYGMARARVANLVEGVSKGFKKNLEINGVGYRAALKGKGLVLNLGFSHQVEFTVPEGVKIDIDKKATKLEVSGISKDLVGETAAQIRALRKPEPYKGTGIKYAGERIHRKAGKTAAGAGAGK